MMPVHGLAGSWASLAHNGSRRRLLTGAVLVVAKRMMALSGAVLAVLDRKPRAMPADVFTAHLVTMVRVTLRRTWRPGRLVPSMSASSSASASGIYLTTRQSIWRATK